jgi:excisionase family DNA binding protein
MIAPADAINSLITQAARMAIEEAAPHLVEKLVPVIVEQVRAALDGANHSGVSVQYVPVKLAAEMMSAHPSTVRKLILGGKLGRYSIEGQLRVKVSDVHAYLSRGGGSISPTIDLRQRALAILKKTPSNDT